MFRFLEVFRFAGSCVAREVSFPQSKSFRFVSSVGKRFVSLRSSFCFIALKTFDFVSSETFGFVGRFIISLRNVLFGFVCRSVSALENIFSLFCFVLLRRCFVSSLLKTFDLVSFRFCKKKKYYASHFSAEGNLTLCNLQYAICGGSAGHSKIEFTTKVYTWSHLLPECKLHCI